MFSQFDAMLNQFYYCIAVGIILEAAVKLLILVNKSNIGRSGTISITNKVGNKVDSYTTQPTDKSEIADLPTGNRISNYTKYL